MGKAIAKKTRSVDYLPYRGLIVGIEDTVFQTLVENAAYGICIFRGDDRLFVNQAYVEQHGFSSIEHALASDAYVGSDKIEVEEWHNIFPHLEDGKPYRFRMLQPDGNWNVLEASYSRITIEGESAWVSTTRDVTDNDRSRRELRASEARFRELFELAPVGIAIAGADRVTTDANAAFADMLGTTISGVIGRRVRDFGSSDSPPEHIEIFQRLVNGEIDIITGDRELFRVDGTPVSVHMITVPVRDDDGRFLYALRVFEDITERMNMVRAQNEFMAITSHELRTPLTAIHAAVSLVASGAYGPLPGPAQRLLEIAAENSDRMVDLTTDLIDLERMDLGKLTMVPVPSDAADLVARARDSVATIADEAGVEITVDAQSTSLPADETRVAQVLSNLLTNALKFSERGSVVGIEVRSERSVVRFSVNDNGPGISELERTKIFDRFHQVDSSDTRSQGGWGLGLAVSKAIVEQHGGNLWVESELGTGSTFIFELPSALPQS